MDIKTVFETAERLYEQDAADDLETIQVALLIGWTWVPTEWGYLWKHPTDNYQCSQLEQDFNPLVDAGHDYEVLKWVREHWNDGDDWWDFVSVLAGTWIDRGPGRKVSVAYDFCTRYEEGDYSRAALAVLQEAPNDQP